MRKPKKNYRFFFKYSIQISTLRYSSFALNPPSEIRPSFFISSAVERDDEPERGRVERQATVFRGML